MFQWEQQKGSQTKFVTNETRKQKMFALKIASKWTESRDCKAIKSLIYVFMAICGIVWPFMVSYGLCMALLWSFMAKYWFDWTFLVFSRDHRFKFIWSCFFQTCNVVWIRKKWSYEYCWPWWRGLSWPHRTEESGKWLDQTVHW